MADISQQTKLNSPAHWLIYLGALSIVVGGALSAGMAHQPSRLVMWASAYLVLAAGVAQVVLGLLLIKLRAAGKALWGALVLFNVGGLLVIFGTVYKKMTSGVLLLDFGEIVLLLSLIIMAYAIRHTRRSAMKTVFYLLTAVMILSMLVGLGLSMIIDLG